MCWDETPTGVFQSDKASKASDKAISDIKSLIREIVGEEESYKTTAYLMSWVKGYNTLHQKILESLEVKK